MKSILQLMFSAFSPLNGGTPDTYYYDAEYPYDLNGSLDFTRPATGVAVFPFPLTIPAIDGLLPLFDSMEYSMMLGKMPYGPYTQPNQMYDMVAIFPDISGNAMGRLSKVSG